VLEESYRSVTAPVLGEGMPQNPESIVAALNCTGAKDQF
jgi:hypothetical protein